MNGYNLDSPNIAFARRFKVAAASIVIGLVMAASNASNDVASTVTQHDAAANAAAATATHYFPSPYVLNAAEAMPHIVAMIAVSSAAMLLFACASTPRPLRRRLPLLQRQVTPRFDISHSS